MMADAVSSLVSPAIRMSWNVPVEVFLVLEKLILSHAVFFGAATFHMELLENHGMLRENAL